MIVKLNIPDDEAALFSASAQEHNMTLDEWFQYCAYKQLSDEYAFIISDQEDLEEKLRQGLLEIQSGNTSPLNEVFSRIRQRIK